MWAQSAGWEQHHHSSSPIPPGLAMPANDGDRDGLGGRGGPYSADVSRYGYGDGSTMPPELSPMPPHHMRQQEAVFDHGYDGPNGGTRTPGSSGGGGPVGFGTGGGVSSPRGMGHDGGYGGGGMSSMSPSLMQGSPHDYMGHDHRLGGGQVQQMGYMQPDFNYNGGGGGGVLGMDSPYGRSPIGLGDGAIPPVPTGAEFLLPRWSFNEASASATALIHPAITGWLIGPKGAAIGRLKESTGCRMWVNTARQTLSIRGDSIAELYSAVRAVESHVKSSPVYVDNDVGAIPGEAVRETTVSCPPELLDEMQCHVRSIKRQSGAHTTFVNRKLAAIVITGPTASVQAAVRHVHQVIARAKQAHQEAMAAGLLSAGASPKLHHSATPPLAWEVRHPDGTLQVGMPPPSPLALPVAGEVGSAFETVSSCGSDAGHDHNKLMSQHPHHQHQHATPASWVGMDPQIGHAMRPQHMMGQRPPRSPAPTPGGPSAESWHRGPVSAATHSSYGSMQRNGMAGGGGGGMTGGGGNGSGGGGGIAAEPGDVRALREDMSQLLTKPALLKEPSCATRLLIAAASNDDARAGSNGKVLAQQQQQPPHHQQQQQQGGYGPEGFTRSDGEIHRPLNRGRETSTGSNVSGSERRSRSSPPALAEWDFSIDVSDAVGQSASLTASPIPSAAAMHHMVTAHKSFRSDNSSVLEEPSSSVSALSTPPSGSGAHTPSELKLPAQAVSGNAGTTASSGRWVDDGAHARAVTLLDGDDSASDVSGGGGGGERRRSNRPSDHHHQARDHLHSVEHDDEQRPPPAVGPDMTSPVGSTGSSRASAASSVLSVTGLAPGFQAETLGELLVALGLEKWETTLSDAEVDLAALRLMSDADLAELGLPKGPRVKLMHAQRRGEI